MPRVLRHLAPRMADRFVRNQIFKRRHRSYLARRFALAGLPRARRMDGEAARAPMKRTREETEDASGGEFT